MSRIYQNQIILAGADRYRRGVHYHNNTIALAKKLGASLQMIYVVDLWDLKVPHHGFNPYGPCPGPFLVRGTAREKSLIAEGREELRKFEAACESASIKHSGEVVVGVPEILWAQNVRSCELFMVFPHEKDFGWFGNIFWKIAARSCRPVLILRQDGLLGNRMILFYSGRAESARALPWVKEICFALGTSLTVYISKRGSRRYAHDECQAFLHHHHISVTFKDRNVLDVLESEVKHPGSEIEKPSLLVFDSGFYRGFWFGKYRHFVNQLIRKSYHNILLCP